VRIADINVCPHKPTDGCVCIKPKPYFLERAARDYGVDLRRAFVVGDHPEDVEFARNVGACGIYVLTGHGAKHCRELPRDTIVVSGIAEASNWIPVLARHGNDPLRLGGEIRRAAEAIRRGGVAAFPTETVYGLGADALNGEAVARVFEIKGRPRFDPLIVHVAGGSQVTALAADFPADARALTKRFWPGPLTVILPKRTTVPEITTAGLPTVALRMPDNPIAQGLIVEAGTPIAAPSANPFGHVSPTAAEHVRRQLGGRVNVILDGGPCRVGVESTIVSFAGKRPALLRPGGLPVEDIEAVVGRLSIPEQTETTPLSPGRLPRHYAPRTPFMILPDTEPLPDGLRVGLLCLRPPSATNSVAVVEALSETGDLREAAAGLFAAIRRLDNLGLDLIVARPVPEAGLGRAIMDRLRRACSTHGSPSRSLEHKG
jgi:L-threonylcarbamoyladenylate synthase